MFKHLLRSLRSVAFAFACGMPLLPLAPAFAAQTDISGSPIASTNSAQVKPNIMLLMDTSGSMGWGHMPDEVEGDKSGSGLLQVGYKSAQCNVLYYNPKQTYLLPKKPDGTPFPTPSFVSASYAGYASYYVAPDSKDLSNVDLSANFQAYDSKTTRNGGTPDTAQPAYYYVYSGTQPLGYATAPCTDSDTGVTKAATGGGTWTRVNVASSSAADKANFAVWYSYYRIRISLIKSSASLAFTPLTDTFRVGFITVQPKDSPSDSRINQSKYLKIDDFNSGQRNSWYSKLFSQVPGGASPTREGLARVGRMYAGKHDSINGGMDDDPVQYSCQQNFTILTTDGYWNTQTESSPTGGPLQIDGKTAVGQTDGTLDSTTTSADGKVTIVTSPRPIWDGTTDGTSVVENYTDSYAYAQCGSFASRSTVQLVRSTLQVTASTSQITQTTTQARQTTVQNLASTVQNLASTVQNLVATTQNLQSTSRILASTSQILRSTAQTLQRTSQTQRSTVQNLQSTVQNLQSTAQTITVKSQTTQTVAMVRQSTTQNLQSTAQTLQSTLQVTQSTSQALANTSQILKSTSQNQQSTAQTLMTSLQTLQSTNQNLSSTVQSLQSTSQIRQTTAQIDSSTLQLIQATSQTTIATSQVQQTTSQTRACDARTELCNYVPSANCTPSTFIRCETTMTGPALVASCTPQSASASNNYTDVGCVTSATPATGTAACSPASAGPSNSYTTTTCNTVTTGPSPVAACSTTTPSAGNNYTATSCTSNSTGPTPAAACTPAAATGANNYTATSCSTVTSGPTGVPACTGTTPDASNSYTTTSCTTATTSSVPVASCTAAGPSSANGYTTVSCPPAIVTTGVPTASCTPAGAAASNSFTTTSCSSNQSSNVPVASCLAAVGNSGNGYITTTCLPNNAPNVPVSSCTPASPTSGNGYTTVSCTPNNHTTPVAACSPSGPTPANGYTTTTCPAAVVTTDVPSASCTPATPAAANGFTTTTCRTVAPGATPVAGCIPATAGPANNYTATACTTSVTGPVGVASCTPVSASSANGYTATSCGAVVTTNVPVASCTPSAASSGNGYVATSCTPNNSSSVPVASCTPSGPTSGNGYTTTTCPTPVTTSNVAVASCTPAAAAAANGFTTTSCATTVISATTVVASCTPAAPTLANGFQSTTCGMIVSSAPTASCVASAATAANNYTTTTCPAPVTTTNVPVATCVPSGASAPNYITTTCPAPITTTNVPVATCVASGASAPNYITTTCPAPVTTSNVPVASCLAAAATAANSYTTTTCPIAATLPTGVSSCSASGPTAGNNYTTTTCTPNNASNVAVASCTPSGPGGGNGYTTTTCPAPNTTTNVPVASCSPSGPTAANLYTTTTCPPPISTTNVPVASCSPSGATSANSYTTTTCPTPITTSLPTASCSPIAASAGNNWTTTSCPAPVTTTNVPVATCTPSSALSGNAYVTTTCPAPIVGHDVPQAAACTPSAASSLNGFVTTTCPTAPVTTTNVPVASCTVSAPTAANSYVATSCPAPVVTGPVGVASCTPVAASSANGYTATACPAAVLTGPTGVPSCTPSGPTAANSYVTTTCGNNNTTDVGVSACSPTTPGPGNGYLTTSCKTNTTGPTILAASACTAAAAGASNSFTTTTCVQTFGNKLQYTQTHTVTRQLYSGGVKVGGPVSDPPIVGPATDVNGSCFAPNSEPEPYATPNPEPLPKPPGACTAWPCTTTKVNKAGSTNSLADVAQYYYTTDLRPAADWPATSTKDISTDNVQAVGTGPEDDRVPWQHMTTFTLGLGVSGTLDYRSDYPSAKLGDFASIRTGVSTTNADGTQTAVAWPLWPDPAVDYTDFDNWSNPKSIDDFWHTAVNGRGRYFSAGDPTSVVAGLSGALIGVQARLSSGAAGGVTTTQPSLAVDSRIFISSYTTSDWTGDLLAFAIDLSDGRQGSTPSWSAQALLDARTGANCDDRTIYLMHSGNVLVNFSWDGNVTRCSGSVVSATGLDATEQANFTLANAQLLSQWTSMSTGQQTATPGADLVNFLRGQRYYEGFIAGDATKLYRSRKHVLGDIVDAQPVFVAAPTFGYSDTDYAAFKIAQKDRTPMVYVAANDGMLHAFTAGIDASDPSGGQEAWAVIPSAVLPKMFRLADDNYRNIHQFSVDGTPVVADAHDSGGWKTLLVAGLNDGGRGYYALDVTNPATPRALWEFKAGSSCHGSSETGYKDDCYLGYSFGKPVVTKLTDGTWVVLFTSGYNNIGGGLDDGRGFLYVVNATTGAVIRRISTNAGSAGTPSGLAQINTYLELGAVDNTVVNAYGGDLLGNVWRFNLSTTNDATLIGTAKDKLGAVQPISVRPELAEIAGKPMVLIGTGRLLGASDIGDLQVQSIYGIVDQLTGNPVYADLRGALKPLSMTASSPFTAGAHRDIVDCTPAGSTACDPKNGWVIDFPQQILAGGGSANVGERVNVEMKLALGTLVVGSNVPQSGACTTGGYSWLGNYDLATGLAVQDVAGNLEVSKILSVDSLLVGFNVTVLDKTSTPREYRAVGQLAGTAGGVSSFSQHIRVAPLAPAGKRISWREIVQ